jgi:ketosteroid isomerase-like protein
MAGEKDYSKLTREIYDAYNNGDWDVVRRNTADNAVLTAAALGNKTYKGPSGVVEYMQGHKKALNIKISIQRVIACEDMSVVEFSAKGTHTAPYTMPNGDVIPPSGKSGDIPVCHVLRWKNDKIAEMHTYFDFMSLMNIMGIGLYEDMHTNH